MPAQETVIWAVRSASVLAARSKTTMPFPEPDLVRRVTQEESVLTVQAVLAVTENCLDLTASLVNSR